MEELFLKILNLSISAIWVVLAVVLLRFAMPKAPKALRVVLWGIVGLRLVWPFSIESILSLIPSAETVPPDIGMARVPAIHSGVPVINSSINPMLAESMAATPQYSVNPMQIAQFIATWVWVIGMVGMALYALISWLVIRVRVREAMRERENIWLCDRVGSPFILGLFAPRIYLPSDMAAEDLPFVLAHEQAHIKRKDHLWKPLGFLLLTVHWFNPVMWLAYVLLCRDIELACDEKVVKMLGEEGKKPYSEALIHCSAPRRMITACPVAFGETGVKARIKSVLHYKKPAFWIILVAVIACVAVAVCFLTDPRTEAPITQPPTLTVSGGDGSLTAWRGGYSWSYNQNGETVHTIADADHPTAVVDKLPRIEARPTVMSARKGNTVSLQFDHTPDRVNVIAHALEPTASAGGRVESTAEGFDLLEGDFLYIVDARWDAHGDVQYAFLGSYHLPQIQDPEGMLAELKGKYPAYFGLSTEKGLQVYVWQMAANSFSCGILPGRDTEYDLTELMRLIERPLTLEQARLIVDCYNLPREQVELVPLRMPYSSYYYVINDAYQSTIERHFWGDTLYETPVLPEDSLSQLLKLHPTYALLGRAVGLQKALDDGIITAQQVMAYARVDAAEGRCEEKHETENGLTEFRFYYKDIMVCAAYDVYQTPDGKEHLISVAQVVERGAGTHVGFTLLDENGEKLDREQWGLTFTAVEAAPGSVTVECRHEGGQQIGMLNVVSYGIWSEATDEYLPFPISDPSGDRETWFLQLEQPIPLPEGETTRFTADVASYRDVLSPGNYILSLEVADIYAPEDVHPLMQNFQDRQNHYVEFTVE